VIGSIGSVVFEVSSDTVRTFDNFKREGAARWAKHDVHKIKPVSEFLGVDLDKISFTIHLSTSLGISPQQEIETLRNYRDEGKAVSLLIGEKPVSTGLFTIQSLSEDWKTIDNHGVLMVADVSVELLEYVETVVRPVVKKQMAPLSASAKKTKNVSPAKKSANKAPKKKSKPVTKSAYRLMQEKQIASLKKKKGAG